MSTALALNATTALASVPDEHSDVVGGSSAARILGCPASYGMLKKLEAMRRRERGVALLAALDAGRDPTEAVAAYRNPVKESSEYAEEGTALHEAVAYILERDAEVYDVVGMCFNLRSPLHGGHGIEMSQALVKECIVPAMRMLDDLLDELEDEGGLEFVVEKRCAMPGIPGAFGTSDLIGRTQRRSIVWDWKFGGGVAVSAFESDQLRFYARSGMNSFPHLFGTDDPNWPVDVYIAQPRLSDEPSKWSTTVGELEAWRLTLVEAVREAQEDAEPRLQVGSWCRFAECKAVCPRHAGAAHEFATKLARILPGGEEALPHVEPLATLPDLYATLLDLADIVEPLAGEARRQAKSFVDGGGVLPGWMLVDKKSSGREWSGADEARAYMTEQGMTDDEQHVPREVVSPAQAEKILRGMGKLKSKDKIPGTIASPKPSSGTNLARREEGRVETIPTASKLLALADRLATL